MANDNQIAFLCSRLKELREKNGCTMADMAKKIDVLEGLKPGTGMNKSSISRVEGGKTAEKTLLEMARKYCKVFGMSESQTEQFLRGEKAAVPDTSALLKNSQLIDELNKEYSKVVIPKVVVDELDNIKNKNSGSLGRKAWEVIRGISYGSRTILMEYNGDADEDNEDCKIIYIAQEASDTYHCKVDIITEDTDYSAYLKGHESVSALHLREYMATKQDLINMTKLARIDAYYADSYEECEEPTADEVNAYLQDGNTLIISAVRNNRATIEQRKEKIKWLIQLGADVNKRDCSRRYFPALSHAVQMKDYEMFMFLLLECKANPNVGSRNPFDAGKVRQKNEGNMPLMIAAWEGKKDFVIALCEDERTSINQQDAIAHIGDYLKSGRIAAYTITNGLLVDCEKLEFFKEYNVNVGFSVDGISAIHDKYRCGTHERVMENIALYKEVNGKYPSMNCTVGKEIIDNPEATIGFFEQFGNRITFSRMIGKQGISLPDFNAFLNKAMERLNVRTGGYDCTMYGGMCGAGMDNIFYANGKIFICGNCIDLPFSMPYDTPLNEVSFDVIDFDRSCCFKEVFTG